MTEAEILECLTSLFRESLDDDTIELERDSTTEDVESWDSVSHISLMLGTEELFGIKFSAAEVGGLANVGELVNLIQRRLSPES